MNEIRQTLFGPLMISVIAFLAVFIATIGAARGKDIAGSTNFSIIFARKHPKANRILKSIGIVLLSLFSLVGLYLSGSVSIDYITCGTRTAEAVVTEVRESSYKLENGQTLNISSDWSGIIEGRRYEFTYTALSKFVVDVVEIDE